MNITNKVGVEPYRESWLRNCWSPTTLYWTSALLWSGLIVGAFLPVHLVEDHVFGLAVSPRRMAGNPPEIAMRVVGLSHHVVALVFLLARVRLRALSTWVRLTALAGLGALGCVAFGHFGGKLNPVTFALFYIVFQVHAFRDEALFYRYYEAGAVEAGDRVRRTLLWLQVAATGVLGLVLPAYVFYTRVVGYAETPAWLSAVHFKVLHKEVAALETVIPRAWSSGAVLALTGIPWIVLIVTALARLHAAPAGLRGVWRSHGPLIKTLASSLAVIFSSVLVGGGTLPLIILLHFVAWFQFTVVRFGRVPAGSPAALTASTPFEWLRRTRRGFIILHGGLALLFLFLIALNHWVLALAPIRWGATTTLNPLSLLLSGSAFYYWTIFHVTLSLMPRSAPPTQRG